jgi:integrase
MGMKGRVYKRGKTYSIEVRLVKDENNEWLRDRKGGFRTKKEAEAYLADVIAKANKGEYAEYENMSVKAFLTLWLDEYCKNNLKSSTYANRKNMVETRIIPVLGKYKLEDLKPIHFTRFYNDLHAKDYSPEYIHTMHSCMRTAFKHAFKWQLASRYVMENVDAPKFERNRQLDTWTLQEASAFLKFTESIEHDYKHIAYVLAIFTGMRKGEILGLRWSDIDWNRKTLQVVQTVYKPMKQAPTIQTPKTSGSMRSISLPDNVLDELKIHKKKQNELRLRFGSAYEDNQLVVPRPDGKPMDPRGMNEHFTECIKKSGMKKIRFHDLRHTHATIMLQLGEHPKVVSERLGHSNVNITLDTYSHVLPNMQEDAARKLFEAFKNISN